MVVDKPEENTLRLNLGLINVSTFIPPDKIRSDTIIRKTIGTAVITLEFYDTQTNEILMHGFKRMIVKKIGHESTFTLGAKRWSNIRKMPAAWARDLATKIESVRNL